MAWAGLDKVPATPGDEISALQRRFGDIDVDLDRAQLRLTDEISRLRSLHEGTRALASEGSPVTARYVDAQSAVDSTRDEIAGLLAERQAVSKALARPLLPDSATAVCTPDAPGT